MPLRDGATRFGALIRSDHLGNLNAIGREAMAAYGITTVIDLRSRRELGDDSQYAIGGMTRVNVPLVDDLDFRELGDTPDMFERYLMILDARQAAFRDVFATVAAAEGGVLFHCFAGKDRTGLVAAMLLSLAGVAEEHIAADFAATDLQLASRYELWIAAAPPAKRDAVRGELCCPADRILGVLEHLERGWGGTAGYLEAAGLDATSVEKAAAKLS